MRRLLNNFSLFSIMVLMFSLLLYAKVSSLVCLFSKLLICSWSCLIFSSVCAMLYIKTIAANWGRHNIGFSCDQRINMQGTEKSQWRTKLKATHKYDWINYTNLSEWIIWICLNGFAESDWMRYNEYWWYEVIRWKDKTIKIALSIDK